MTTRSRWGADGPPPDAYSRVSNLARFEPLHGLALDLLGRLERDFAARRVEGYGLDAELERVALARPTVKLTPDAASAAPLVVAFTALPGLMVRCGRWLVEAFPACGCDACDETAVSEGERFVELIHNVVGGRSRESTEIPLLGDARQTWTTVGSSNHVMQRTLRLERSRALAAVSDGSRSLDWGPWPRR